jgi:2-haloacid dehalogenase
MIKVDVMTRFKLILFDADETLFDFNKAERIALSNALGQCRFDCSEEILGAYRVINKKLWLEYEQGNIDKDTLQSKRFEELSGRFGLSLDAGLFNRCYLENLANCAAVIEGAEELCRELSAHYILAVVTNGISVMQRKRVTCSVVYRFLDNIFVSEDTGYQKPMPGFFDFVFNTYSRIGRSETLIVGDSLTADIKGGNNAGIATCWYNPLCAHAVDDYRIDYEIKRLQELKEILL